MFQLIPAPTFTTTAQITQTGGDIALLKVEFKHRTLTGLKVWIDSLRGRDDAEIAPEFIVGWSEAIDDKGETTPFSPAAFATLCENYPAPAIELVNAYVRAHRESRAKN
jgi:hypothetical protein